MEFSGGIQYLPSFSDQIVVRWSPPIIGWWKINSEAAYANGRAAVAFVARDDDGLLIQTSAKCIDAPSVAEAEVLALEWAVLEAVDRGWRNFIFLFGCSQLN